MVLFWGFHECWKATPSRKTCHIYNKHAHTHTHIYREREIKRKRNDRASPAVLWVDGGATEEEELNDVGEALASGDVESGTAVDVLEVDIGAGVEKLLDPVHVALARQVHKPNPRVDHLVGGRFQRRRVGALPVRLQRGLLAESETGLDLHRFAKKKKKKQEVFFSLSVCAWNISI